MASLNPNETTQVKKEQLLDLGFKFQYFTNEYITKSGNVYRFCYDQGYLELSNHKYALVVRKEYID